MPIVEMLCLCYGGHIRSWLIQVKIEGGLNKSYEIIVLLIYINNYSYKINMYHVVLSLHNFP